MISLLVFKIKMFLKWHFKIKPKCKILSHISPIIQEKALGYCKNFHPFIYENIISENDLFAAITTIYTCNLDCDCTILRNLLFWMNDKRMTYNDFLVADMEITYDPYEVKINGIKVPLRLQDTVLILKSNVDTLNEYVKTISKEGRR